MIYDVGILNIYFYLGDFFFSNENLIFFYFLVQSELFSEMVIKMNQIYYIKNSIYKKELIQRKVSVSTLRILETGNSLKKILLIRFSQIFHFLFSLHFPPIYLLVCFIPFRNFRRKGSSRHCPPPLNKTLSTLISDKMVNNIKGSDNYIKVYNAP